MRALLFWSVTAALFVGVYVTSRSPIPLHPPATNQVSSGRKHQAEQPHQSQDHTAPSIVQPPTARPTSQAANQSDRGSGKQDEQRAEGDQPKITDWVQGISAGVSAFVGILLLIVTAFQLKISNRQSVISDRQAGIMETQTALAAESLDIAIKQKEIARQGFLTANRPTIVMRAVTFTVGPHETDPLTICWRLTNIGTVDAHVQSMVVNIELRDPKRRMQTILSSWNIKGGFVLDPGETREMSGVSDSPEMTDQFHRFRNEINTLLHGYVTYFSESGRVHQLGFVRSYEDDGLLGRFKPVDDPERSYSD